MLQQHHVMNPPSTKHEGTNGKHVRDIGWTERCKLEKNDIYPFTFLKFDEKISIFCDLKERFGHFLYAYVTCMSR